MKYTLNITVPTGPTIMEHDTVPVTFTRMAQTPEQVTKLQQAAITLGATNVEISENKTKAQ